jgi:hypothetical protein
MPTTTRPCLATFQTPTDALALCTVYLNFVFCHTTTGREAPPLAAQMFRPQHIFTRSFDLGKLYNIPLLRELRSYDTLPSNSVERIAMAWNKNNLAFLSMPAPARLICRSDIGEAHWLSRALARAWSGAWPQAWPLPLRKGRLNSLIVPQVARASARGKGTI